MNDKQIKHLEHLAELYFAGNTTLTQESELQNGLLDTAGDPAARTPLLEEARAVMGYMAMARSHKVSRAKQSRHSTAWRAAASIAVAIAAGSALLIATTGRRDVCQGWIGGRPVESESGVIALMQSDLSAFGRASADLEADASAQFAAIGRAMSSNDSQHMQ